MFRRLTVLALSVILMVVAFQVPAEATFLSGLLKGDTAIQDLSREAYIDTNSSGTFNAGDTIIGFAKISEVGSTPMSANSQVYAVFSITVTAIGALHSLPSPLGFRVSPPFAEG